MSFAKMFPTIAGKCACGCGKELPKGKRRWFSDGHSWKCYERYALLAGISTVIRDLVFKRDKAICKRCGTDCEKQKRYWRDTGALWTWLAMADNDALFEREVAKCGFIAAFYMKPQHDEFRTRYLHAQHLAEQKMLAASGRKNWHGHAWEADHIKAVAEGGGGCGLENYQTLCIACHKWKTRQLVRRLAMKRRTLQPELLRV